jgi:hypothetical protein
MSPPRPQGRVARSRSRPRRSPQEVRRRQQDDRRRQQDERRRRLAVLVAISLVALVMLLVSAFGGATRTPASLAAPSAASALLPAGPPSMQVIARLDGLDLQIPINQARVTAIGYFGGGDGALTLDPVGTQANQGLLKRLAHKVFGGGSALPRWYQLPGGRGPATSAVDVGAAAGTDVYAPVDGTIVGITKLVLNGRTYGRRIDIQPTDRPSVVVSVSRIRPDPALKLGAAVTAAGTKLGRLLDLSTVERQELARYTNDEGNHALLQVHPAATLQFS